jgi:hypothetical protein
LVQPDGFLINSQQKAKCMKNQNLSKTGEKCPRSGEWVALDDINSSAFVKKGEEMPPFRGRSINWQFKQSL